MAKRVGVTEEAGVGKPTSTDALNGDGLGTLCAGGEGFLWRIEGRVEKSIDEGRLAEARLACTPTSRVSSLCCMRIEIEECGDRDAWAR